MKLTIKGAVGATTGYGIVARNFAQEIMKTEDVRVISTDGKYPSKEMKETSRKSQEGRLVISVDLPVTPADVYYTMFEHDQAPARWGHFLRDAKLVMTPSEFSKRSLSTICPEDKIKVVNCGVDMEEFNPGGKKMKFWSEDAKITDELNSAYKFLYVAEWVERKRIPDVIKAFTNAFSPHEDVCLLLKVFSGAQPVNRLIRKQIEGYESVYLLGGKYESLAPIYRAVNCYVSSSASEGWGEPLAEAMACGIPVISGRIGGQMEFLTENNSFLVPPAKDEGEMVGHNILEPTVEPWFKYWPVDVNILSKWMRWVYEHDSVAKKRAELALNDIKKFTWARATTEMLKYLETLY